MKSKDWVNRQKKDIFVNKAKNEGYVSRSAYKIIEIDKKYKLLNNAKNILELGSAPGGWSQATLQINPKVKICGFDLLDMKYSNQNFNFYKEDFLSYNYEKFPHKFDLILSDIAPNTTGHQSTDHLRIAGMIESIICVLDQVAKFDSSFVFKLWKGREESLIINNLKEKYKKISYFKPKSSRSESSEIFIVAQKYIN